MRISPVLLARLLACSALFGIALAIANSVLRAAGSLIYGNKALCLRRATDKESKGEAPSRKRGVLKWSGALYTFILDVALFLVGGAGILLLSYYFNYGEIRGVCVIGAVAGFVLCHVTVGKAVRLFFERLGAIIRDVILIAFKAATLPLTIFLKICKKILKFLLLKIVNAIEKRAKVLYNNNELLYIHILSDNGFDLLSKKGFENNVENNDSIMRKE